MRIEGLAAEVREGAAVLRASIAWEDCARSAQEIFFEIQPAPAPIADALADQPPDPHPFLLAAAAPALRFRERRIALEGPISPRLEQGVNTALQTLADWYHPGRTPPFIEASRGRRPGRPAPEAATGLALSGGLDSLAVLRRNRLHLAPEHPRSVRIGVFVDGFDINAPGTEDESEFADRAFAAIGRAVADDGLELIRVRTNLRALKSRWAEAHHGAAVAAVAHACRPRIGRMLMSAGPRWKNMVPHGSHPLLDRHYSSECVELEHSGANHSRVENARLISQSPRAIDNLRVCWNGVRVGGPLNCSECHKCVLTMLALVCAGSLERCQAFGHRDVTPAMVSVLRPRMPGRMDFLEELVAPLRAVGRGDLAAAVEAKMTPGSPGKVGRARAAVRARWRATRLGIASRLGAAR